MHALSFLLWVLACTAMWLTSDFDVATSIMAATLGLVAVGAVALVLLWVVGLPLLHLWHWLSLAAQEVRRAVAPARR